MTGQKKWISRNRPRFSTTIQYRSEHYQQYVYEAFHGVFLQKYVFYLIIQNIITGNVNHFRIALCILFFVFLEKNILLYKSFVLYKVLRYQEKHYNDTFQDTIEREHYS
jgi:hypothetical protein